MMKIKEEKMSKKTYSIKELMHEHEDYEFSIKYDSVKKELTTNVKIPSNILAQGVAFALADLPITESAIEIYLDEIKLKIRQIRKEDGISKQS